MDAMIRLARALLDMQDSAVIVDTETTGFSQVDEVIDIAVMDMKGAVLLNTKIKPISAKVGQRSYAVHGILNRVLANAPSIASVPFDDLFAGRYVVGYNTSFDARMLQQSCRIAGVLQYDGLFSSPVWQNVSQRPTAQSAVFVDILEPYARHYGLLNKNRKTFKQHKLTVACEQQGVETSGAHSALGDCCLVLQLLRAIAEKAA